MSSDRGASIYDANQLAEPDDFDRFVREYCDDELGEIVQQYPKEKTVFEIDWSDVYQWNPDIAGQVKADPEGYAGAFEKAIRYVNTSPVDLEDILVRFANVGDPIKVTEVLKGHHAGEAVTVTAQVEKVTDTHSRLTEAKLRCQSCGSTFTAHYPEHGDLSIDNCQAMDCRSKRLKPVFNQSKHVEHQLARLTVPSEADDSDAHVDVHLTRDVAGSLQGGERVDVTGILRDYFPEWQDPTPEFYLTEATVSHHEEDYKTIDTSEHRDTFEAIANGEHGDPYQLLVDSVAPSIMSDEHMDTIKLSIGLALFGGWRRPYGDGRYARGDPHIVLIGAPQTGKSSLLNAVEELSPRSSFISGKNASKAGITAAAVRDDFGDTEWSLEAGAIVNAHKGVACIDEIDKVEPDALSSLHTALEKQRLEVSKAGINATLPCETTVVGAGNPKHGHFIPEEPVVPQLNIAPALRSRFDLIFCLTQEADEEEDRELAHHMSTIRREAGLADRGEMDIENLEHATPAIPPEVLRSFIAYARQNVYPVIEDDALHDLIAEEYAKVRSQDDGEHGVGPRNIDAIHRLAEASARVRLSETVERQDVDRAVRLIKGSLRDLDVLDEDGNVIGDISVLETGISEQDRREHSTVKGIIRTLGDGGFVDATEVVDVAASSDAIDKSRQEIRQHIRRLVDGAEATTNSPGSRFDVEEAEVRVL